MAETQYTSTLTGPELDEALRDAAGVDAKVEQAQSAAQQAAQSASSAQGYASAASGSASQASTSAGQAAESAADASGQADAAAESAQQAAASAASIEGDVEQAASSASAAAQSATQASGSASAAAQSASAAADSEDSVQQNAAAAQQAAAAASQSKSDAEAAASNAASSASTAQQAASLIEENLSAIQAAPSNAQAAQQAAAQAAASASAAEDAAERAEQIADFNPADFATAAQGAKADTAVQSVNGEKPDARGNVQLDLTTGTVRSVNGKDPDGSGNVQLSAGDVGAATAAQGTKADTAVQPAALDGYAKTSDIPTVLPNPQALGIQLGSGGSVTSYDGSVSRTVAITPEAIGAQPAGAAAGGGKMTLIRDTGWDSCNIGQTISLPDLSGYDAIGIQVVPDAQKSATDRSQMNIFPIPASGSSECMLCASEIDSGTNFAELVARRLTISGTTLTISTLGYFLSLPGGPPSAQLCVPRTIYGIKF